MPFSKQPTNPAEASHRTVVLVDSVDVFALGMRHLLTTARWPITLHTLRHDQDWPALAHTNAADLLVYTVVAADPEVTRRALKAACDLHPSLQVLLVLPHCNQRLQQTFALLGYRDCYLLDQPAAVLMGLLERLLYPTGLRGPEQPLGPAFAPPHLLGTLTPRQQQILQMLGEGLTVRRIADVLTVSVKTVEAHCHTLKSRLQIRSFHELVIYAVHVRSQLSSRTALE
jgi:DNA-binding NarL/FixJ family response regulator